MSDDDKFLEWVGEGIKAFSRITLILHPELEEELTKDHEHDYVVDTVAHDCPSYECADEECVAWDTDDYPMAVRRAERLAEAMENKQN